MAVTTTKDGRWKTATGTKAEVLAELNSDEVNNDQVENFLRNSSDSFTALYWQIQ